jgi:hypothetical protein
MMGPGVEVETGVSGLAVHFVTQRAIRSSVNIQVQEWKVAFTFGFHGVLNGLFTDFCYPNEGGARFLLNVGSYKSHTS